MKNLKVSLLTSLLLVVGVFLNFSSPAKAAVIHNPVCVADISHDGLVDVTDFSTLSGDQGTYTPGIYTRSDLNFDSSVNSVDNSLFTASFGQSCPSNPVNAADINNDGVVDISDFNIFVSDNMHLCSHGQQLSCRSDINQNGVVNSADYSLLVASFGQLAPTNPVCAADINHDGVVDITDFSILKNDINQHFTDTLNHVTDINHDGHVDMTDFNLLQASFGQICPSN